MNSLEDILVTLLEAEAEAQKIVSDSKDAAKAIARERQDNFVNERLSEISQTNEKARAIIDKASDSAKAEAMQLADDMRQEMARLQKNYDDNIDKIISDMVNETAEYFIIKKRGAN